MLDINLFREEKGHDPELVRQSQRSRFAAIDVVDHIIALDKEWRLRQFEVENLCKEFNKVNKQVAQLKIEKHDASDMIAKTQQIKQSIAEKELEVKEVWETLNCKLQTVGNLVHESVPISDDEADNAVIRSSGVRRLEPKLKNHVELVELLGIADLKKGADVAGGRGYSLIGDGQHLNQALICFGLDFLESKGYTRHQPPFFIRKEVMAKCAQLTQFDEELYKVTGEGDDKYLIATAEQALCGHHANDWIHPSELPIRYAGFSTCFRTEAGSHGRDTLGLFRVHQFEKVEQFCMTTPNDEDSWGMHEEMIKNSEEFYNEYPLGTETLSLSGGWKVNLKHALLASQSKERRPICVVIHNLWQRTMIMIHSLAAKHDVHFLKLPYQIVNIVSGALNDSAEKKYDLEGWFPASQTYRELVSCSNCTDYQSRRLEIRYGQKKSNEQEKQYVHLLNSTLTATERTICCILENYQQEDGVKIPEVLQPYMKGKTFLPFKRKPGVGNKGKQNPNAIPVMEEPQYGPDWLRVQELLRQNDLDRKNLVEEKEKADGSLIIMQLMEEVEALNAEKKQLEKEKADGSSLIIMQLRKEKEALIVENKQLQEKVEYRLG